MSAYRNDRDLIQNMREMQRIAAEIDRIFQKCEDNIDEIFNLRDQFADLESRTIKIVEEFEKKITEQSDNADALIAGYKEQLETLTKRIEELMGITEDFESIANQVQELLGLRDTVNELTKKVEALSGKSGIIVIPKGENIPIEERKEGTVYFQVTEERTSLTDETILVVSPNMGLEVVKSRPK